jgi:hypothetical protein
VLALRLLHPEELWRAVAAFEQSLEEPAVHPHLCPHLQEQALLQLQAFFAPWEVLLSPEAHDLQDDSAACADVELVETSRRQLVDSWPACPTCPVLVPLPRQLWE